MPPHSCSTAGGSYPFSKRARGQRLDGTGLYFYNARYYDAALGRFISPDPLVQAPYNSQSLNRFSYVINNPLVYTDPSGLIFEFLDEEIEAAYNGLINAPDTPEWVVKFLLELEASEIVIEVGFNPLGDGNVAQGGRTVSMILGVDNGAMIWLDPDLKDKKWGTLRSVLAHEAYHIYEGNFGSTIEEETTAYTIQFVIGLQYGLYGCEGGPCNGNARLAQNVVLALGVRQVSVRTGLFSYSDKYLQRVQENVLGKLKSSSGSIYRSMVLRQEDLGFWGRLKLIWEAFF